MQQIPFHWYCRYIQYSIIENPKMAIYKGSFNLGESREESRLSRVESM